jgi:hypothetical protein
MFVYMFAKHPQVSVPIASLNSVQEFYPLHGLFIKFMDATPLHSETYAIDEDELRLMLDAYMLNIDQSKSNFLLKLPYYPLNCLDFFVDYFEGNITLLFPRRPIEKVVQSFVRRGEDKKFFDDPHEFIRQVKKLEVERRKEFLASKDAEGFFREMGRYCDDKRREWDMKHPENQFIEIDVEQVASSRDYLTALLHKLNLSTDCVDDMLSVVDQERLLTGQQHHSRDSRFKKIARDLTPPALWSFASRLRRATR